MDARLALCERTVCTVNAAGGNRSEAARRLHVSTATITNRLLQYSQLGGKVPTAAPSRRRGTNGKPQPQPRRNKAAPEPAAPRPSDLVTEGPDLDSPRNQALRAAWENYWVDRSLEHRNTLVVLYLPLVRRIAGALVNRCPMLELDDLANAGVPGLMDVIDRYKPELGYRFTTYAPARLRGAMIDEIRSRDDVPRLARAKQTKLREMREQLTQQLGRPATFDEVLLAMEESGITTLELSQLMDLAKPVISLNSPTPVDNTEFKFTRIQHLLDCLVAGTTPAAKQYERHQLLIELTTGCSMDEKVILYLYYFKDCTMKTIGSVLQLSESRVSQMHGALLTRLGEAHKAPELFEALRSL